MGVQTQTGASKKKKLGVSNPAMDHVKDMCAMDHVKRCCIVLLWQIKMFVCCAPCCALLCPCCALLCLVVPLLCPCCAFVAIKIYTVQWGGMGWDGMGWDGM